MTFDERVVVYFVEVSSSESQYQIDLKELERDDEDRLALFEDRAGMLSSSPEDRTSRQGVQKLRWGWNPM